MGKNSMNSYGSNTNRLVRRSGGIRGIAELELLRLIHVALGGKIPLHAFFDLIVGTR